MDRKCPGFCNELGLLWHSDQRFMKLYPEMHQLSISAAGLELMVRNLGMKLGVVCLPLLVLRQVTGPLSLIFLSVQALETWEDSRYSGLALLTPDLVQILFTRIPQFLEHSIFLPSITPSLSFLPSISVPPTRLSGSMPIFLDGNQVSSQMVNRWFLEKQKSV